jgi:ABC-2 type transport system permease protein
VSAGVARLSGPAGFFRLLGVGGIISYRALFNWLRPAIYIPTMLGSPFFQIIFFAYLGRFSGVRDDSFFVVGNAVQVCSMSAIYGGTMMLANERWLGTLSSLLATPGNRAAIFLGRMLPVIGNGLVVSIFGFLVGAVFLDFHPRAEVIPGMGLALLISVMACSAFGMALGALGLRARDVFFVSNLAYFLMLLFCGINVPLEALPAPMQMIGHALPLTNGIAASRLLASGEPLSRALPALLAEVVVGLGYALLAYALFKYFERAGRHHGVFDRM